MTRSELTGETAAGLAALVRRRMVSPVEIVEAHLRHIERLNPLLNAVVTLAPDAVERAREAERAVARGDTLGPLHGVPVTVKDTIETKGLRTTAGSLLRAAHVPARDAPAVALLRRAGAILLGKTNSSEMAVMDLTSDNPLFGRTNNPYDTARTPGGSGGGDAAAVGACLSAAGLGSDLSGSIRVPAHFCGVVGLKPTAGRVPVGGHHPPVVDELARGASIGPVARRVEDVALLHHVLTGGDPGAWVCEEREEGARRRPLELRGARVAWYSDEGCVPVGEETRRAVELAARALAEGGLEPFEARPPAVESAPRLWDALFARRAADLLAAEYDAEEERAGASVRAVIEARARLAPPDERVWEERARLLGELIEWMRDAPLLLAPVGAVPAFAHGLRRVEVVGRETPVFRAFSYAQAFNVLGLPAVSVPAAWTREGLPIGVQIAGPPGGEGLVLSAARVVEEALGGWRMPPVELLTSGHNPL